MVAGSPTLINLRPRRRLNDPEVALALHAVPTANPIALIVAAQYNCTHVFPPELGTGVRELAIAVGVDTGVL